MLNLMDVTVGQFIVMKSGDKFEVIENIGDGMWLKVKLEDGSDELVFCEDIAELAQA